MTIYEQIKKVMEGKNGMLVTSGFLKSELERKYGRNISSVIPSDFCYNRVNEGIDFRKDNRLFKYIGVNDYEYLAKAVNLGSVTDTTSAINQQTTKKLSVTQCQSDKNYYKN